MKALKLSVSVLLILLLAAGCIVEAGPQSRNRPPDTAAATASPTASLIPSLPPSATPTARPTPPHTLPPTPTPTPVPTPTPDPWAEHFSPEGPYLRIKDADRGPWIYKDETLSITITLTGARNKRYYKADIYSRGPLPFSGFAKKNPKGTSTELPYKIAREHKAVLAITGEYIAASYNPKGVIICGGKVYYDRKKAPTLAFLPGGDMRVYEPGETNAQKLLALGVQNSFSFWPIVVKNGKTHPSVKEHKLNYHSWRAAVGQVEPGHWIIVVTQNAILLTDLAKIFIDNGCGTAFNLDGGYSAALVFMGEQLNKNFGSDEARQRGLPDMLMIGTSDAVPGVDDPVYATGIKFNKKYRPKPTDGLIRTN